MSENKEKILIMGPGSSGTTFCFRLLEGLGFDTGRSPEHLKRKDVRSRIDAGEDVELPQVLKHGGGFTLFLSKHIERHDWKVKHIIIALRGLENQGKHLDISDEKMMGQGKAAVLTGPARQPYWKDIKTLEGKRRAALHYRCSGAGMAVMQVIQHDYPYTIVCYPRTVEDPHYCYDKFKSLIEDVVGFMSFEEFEKIWQEINHHWPVRNAHRRVDK